MSRAIPQAILDAAQAGATTLAQCWRVTRSDGRVYRWTDHDLALAAGGEIYDPAQGVTATDADGFIDLAARTITAMGALDDAAMTDADIAAGLWDGATVRCMWVDWSDTTRFWIEFEGRLGEITRGKVGWEAEVYGAAEAAQTPRGRSFGRLCDAVFGDARCGVDATLAAYQGDGTVIAALSRTVFTASGLGAFASGWFDAGRAVWLTGANAGQAHDVRLFTSGATAKLSLWNAPRATPMSGDTLRLTAGCDKRFATCKAKFANAVNFRGFPHMPGDLAAVATLDGAEPRDGSGRNVGRD